MSDDFFAGLEKDKPENTQEFDLEIKRYPAWVEQSRKPDKTMVMYDVVINLFEEAKKKIEAKSFKNASEVTLSQAKVCENIPFLKGRSGLKNHPKIIDEIASRNKKLSKLLKQTKEKTGKSTARKTMEMVKAELEEYKRTYEAKTQAELERLLNSELLISQADALNQIAKYKKELAEVRDELADVKYANTKLQDENFRLQERLLSSTKKPNLKATK